jgi:hypothetical protein
VGRELLNAMVDDTPHLHALQRYWRAHKAFPSMAKLTEVLGLRSTGGVFKVVGRLVVAGYLERVEARIAPTAKFFERPFVAGAEAETRLAEAWSLDEYLVAQPDKTSLVRVPNDALKHRGIFKGDVALVERFDRVDPSELGAWKVKGERGEEFALGTPADFSRIVAAVFFGRVAGIIRRFDRAPASYPGAEAAAAQK